MTRMVHCVKLNKDAEGLDFPPVPGELGKRIYESVSKEAWEDWKKLQTMIINEYGLKFRLVPPVPCVRQSALSLTALRSSI